MKTRMPQFNSTGQHLRWFTPYVGYLRPDTPVAAKVYYTMMLALHPKEALARRRAVRSLIDPASPSIDPAQGYKVFTPKRIPVLEAALKHCDFVRGTNEFQESTSSSKKRYLQNIKFSLTEPEDQSVFDLACHPLVLGPVATYLKTVPVLHRAGLSYSPNTFWGGPNHKSHMFHMDRQDYRQIKCHVFVDDITEDSGPLTVIASRRSREIYRALRKSNPTATRLSYHEDHTIQDLGPQAQPIPLCGPRGSIALVDTCNCYHYGSRPGKKPRYVLYLHFASAFSIDLPAWSREYGPVPESTELTPEKRSIRRFVLGPSFSHFSAARRKRFAINLKAVRQKIETAIPETDKFILVGAPDLAPSAERALDFLETGAPVNDAMAISRLEQLRQRGAAFIVVLGCLIGYLNLIHGSRPIYEAPFPWSRRTIPW